MNDLEALVSTRQASELLDVHESTIKRWCNAGTLPCTFTRGGHRRIAISDLSDLAGTQHIDFALARFGTQAEKVWLATRRASQADDFESLVDLSYRWALACDSSRLLEAAVWLQTEGFTLAQIYDGLFGPLMGRVGMDYQAGRLSIGGEHRVTACVRDSLVLLRRVAEQRAGSAGDRPTALVGCARGEVHELGALMVRTVLEERGWQVIYLGLDLPTEEFASQQAETAADLVCIAMTPPMGRVDAQSIVSVLDQLHDDSRPYRLALGGSGLSAENGVPIRVKAIREVRLFDQMSTFAEWASASGNSA